MKKIRDAKIIAHRGLSGKYPENTMLAFEKALECGADMLELDVTLTADGHVVVIHDDTVDRTTNGQGKLRELDLAYIRTLDAGVWKNDSFSGLQIPLLEEVLEYFGNRISINVEIKPESVQEQIEGGIEEQVMRLIDKYGCRDNILISSFNPRAIRHMKHISPDILCGILFDRKCWTNEKPSEIVNALGCEFFHCSRLEISDEWLQDLGRAKIPVNIYTVDDAREAASLFSRGVNAIFTNRSDEMLSGK